MNQQNYLIAAGLLLPIIVVALLANSVPDEPNTPTPYAMQAAPQAASGEVRKLSNAPSRLPPVEGKARQRTAENTPPPAGRRPPASLDEAKIRLNREMKRLNSLTQQEWEREQNDRLERKREWDRLPQEEKLRVMQRRPPAATPQPAANDQEPELPAPQKEDAVN